MENQDKKITEMSVGLLKILNEKSEELIRSISKIEELVNAQNENINKQSAEFDIRLNKLLTVSKSIEIPEVKLPNEFQQFINRIDIKIKDLKSILNKSHTNTKILLFGLILSVIGFLSLYFSYSIAFKTKNEIIQDYSQKLISEKKILSEDELKTYRKIQNWIDNNPKESKKIIESIN